MPRRQRRNPLVLQKYSVKHDRIVEMLRGAVYGREGYGRHEDLAMAIGAHPAVISRWLCGKHVPAPPYAWAIVEAHACVLRRRKQAEDKEPLFQAPWVAGIATTPMSKVDRDAVLEELRRIGVALGSAAPGFRIDRLALVNIVAGNTDVEQKVVNEVLRQLEENFSLREENDESDHV